MRLGLFGGSFDPIHYGHLLLAEYCRAERQLDEVWFMPAAQPPHKLDHVLAPAEDRIQMLELATGGHEAFRVSRLEIERGGVSYTVDTLEQLKSEDPTREIFFLLGSDSLAALSTWRNAPRICELATPVVVRRRGAPIEDMSVLANLVPPQRREQICAAQVEMPVIELSSSEIRRRTAAGQSIRYQTPRAVEKYIESHGLYRAAR